MTRKREVPIVSSWKDQGPDLAGRLGLPGQFPFTRGIHPTMYRGRLWTMRQYAGFGTAQETNERFRYLIGQGQTGLSIAFDLPTQLGLDSDDPLAHGEVGHVGVAIDTLDDMERLFEGIDPGSVSTSMTINSPATVLLGMYIITARRNGADVRSLSGTVQNDVLKEYIARGTYIFPPGPSMRLVGDLIEWCSRETPRWNPISISGYHVREAGSTAVQELAFTFANAIAYVEAVKERGIDVDDFAGRLTFFFSAHNDLLEEVAKFRAARRIWATIMKDMFGARKERSMMLRFHAQTAGSTLAARQPENNVVRVTLQTIAAVLGGAQSIHTNSMDEALALPSEGSVRLALRTQQIIAHESGLVNTADPAGGAYFVEWLTDEVEEDVLRYLEIIRSMGGAIRAIEKGYMQKEVAASAYEIQKAIDSMELPVIGSNMFKDGVGEDRDPRPRRSIDRDIEGEQRSRLAMARDKRESGPVEAALDELARSAEGEGNLMDPVIKAVGCGSTVGEICQVMKRTFGVHRPTDNDRG